MSLDGLRAWIGEVERKLGMRTRVFLVLAVIAIGGAGAAIYLSVEAREDSVSESDVQALQQRLEARIGEGGGTAGASVSQLEAELEALRAQVERLGGEGAGSPQSKGGEGGGSAQGKGGGEGGSSGGGSGAESGGGAGEGTGGGTAEGGKRSAKLQELLEQAKKQNEEAEKKKGQ
jgi:hypothetical protein